MTLPELGHAIIINNLRSQAPDTVSDVQALRAALETVGFNVECYDDCNVQVSALYYDFTFAVPISQIQELYINGNHIFVTNWNSSFLSGS